MLMTLVFPYNVCIVALRFSFSFFVINHSGVSIPSLFSTYIIASSQALSYAFVTSKNTTYAAFFFLLIFLISSFVSIMCSDVDLFFCPPAWLMLILSFLVILSFMILSKSFPKLLPRVIPLSLEHFPRVPLPL